VNENVPLGRMTTMGTGGVARYFAEVASIDEVQEAVRLAADKDLPFAVIGLGSNLLVADEGFPGVVVRLVGELAKVSVDGHVLRAGGGASLAVCLHRARAAELGGFEFACAIPGTVGGGVWMNAGAYGGEMANALDRALVVDALAAEWRDSVQLGLEYRRSNLNQGEVVVKAEIRLSPTGGDDIRAVVAEMQSRRKAAQPTNRRTFGSVFKNPLPELAAGRAVEAVGLRGHRHGGAQISPKHANFIENTGDAVTEDALELIRLARSRVYEQYGLLLETEVQFLGPGSAPVGSWPPDAILG
jgi:UDP-N-acetylmuramate dehydrogenase